MKAPFSWLKEYVRIDYSVKELAEKLTFSGLEVEGVDNYGCDLEGVVAAEILNIKPHPSAEELLVCEVHDGADKLQVVCGARNFSVGDKVPLARTGTVLPGGLNIQTTNIRGAVSQGMLCAEDELELSNDHSGLMLLPIKTKPGTPLSKIIGPIEPVLNIEVTPNRADCFSIIGIAREIAALSGKRLKLPKFQFNENGPQIDELVKISVEDDEACPRYTARVIQNIQTGPAPLWMRRRLMQCGIRPINNIVDITNYVMMECGQPLHAFDGSLIAENRIIVRRAKGEEKITTLDEAEHKLTPDMLVIADAKAPVALAGVMGGALSGISAETTSVLLESACFKPAIIRSTAKTLGLFSESSRRFEHGVDILNVEWAGRRAAALMESIAKGKIVKGVIDVFTRQPEQRKIICRFDRVKKILGAEIPNVRTMKIFKSLELEILENDRKNCLVGIPSFRLDLENETDLLEEIARINGLEKIPFSPSRYSMAKDIHADSASAPIMCRASLRGLGLTEIANYSFISDALLNLFFPEQPERRVVLPRPISAEHSILRNSLLPQMGDTLRRNSSRQTEEAALFEMGRVFFKNTADQLGEEERIAIGIMGPIGKDGLDKRSTPGDEETFLWLKGIFEALCKSLNLSEVENRIAFALSSDFLSASSPFPLACFAKDRAVFILLDGLPVGIIGLLKHEIRDEWRLRTPVALLEIRTEPLLREVFNVRSSATLPMYPSISRDMAMVVAETVTHEQIIKVIKKTAPKELTAIQLFDIYHSKEIGAFRKGMAYSLKYRSWDRTLKDDEINELHAAIKAGIKHELSAEIREG